MTHTGLITAEELRERLDRAARLVHAEHDQFSWRTCGHETCRALREVTE